MNIIASIKVTVVPHFFMKEGRFGGKKRMVVNEQETKTGGLARLCDLILSRRQ